jgi:hypothetical protein
MDMEIARLTNVYWLQIPDRQVVAMRTAWLHPDRSQLQSVMSSEEDPRRVPMLDWPATLFQDESLDH